MVTETSNTSKIIKRDKYSCIYSSSYDRGLEHLLKMWPEVKKAVPKATLHIFYGWKLFEKFYRDNPGMMAWKERMEKMMEYDGITHHGRVPQPEMDRWYAKCGLWTYPTHFDEISCITAMKAQAYGAIPVVMDKAALKETVKYGVKVEGDIYDPKVQEKYRDRLIVALKSQEAPPKEQMMKWAREEFKWSKVAENWSKEFKHESRG